MDVAHRLVHLGGRVADAHRATAEHVRGTDEHRIADPLRDLPRLFGSLGDPPRRHPDPELVGQPAESLAVLGEVDRTERGAEDRDARCLERGRELQRRLPAELDHDALRPLARAHREHRRRIERLEVQAVARVVVGRDGLGIRVDHHGFVSERTEGLRSVHAAVVELDPLPDPVRAAAEDDDAWRPAVGRRLVGLVPGRVVVGRLGGDLAGARVDPTVDRRLGKLPLALDCDRLELALEPRVEVLGPPVEDRLETALGLDERLEERATDAHRLADRFHLRAESPVCPGKLLEREARDLHDHVVECRLEAGRRRLRQVVRDLVERVADRQLRGDLCDRVAGRLRRECGRARDARVHLDHPDLTGGPLTRELDVRAAAFDADGTDHRSCRVPQLLIGLVGERHLRCDGDRVAGVHAHRVEVLDRADDHDVVDAVAHDLELELVPAAHRLLDENLADRALAQAALDLCAQLVLGLCKPSAVAAERERRPHDRRCHDSPQPVEARDRLRPGNAQPGTLDAVLEQLPVLGPVDHVERRTDQLHLELVEDSGLRELARQVERGLAAHGRQHRVGTLAAQYRRDAFEIERLEVRTVREARIGHDRRRVGVDDDRAKAVVAKHFQRLAARVVELARLPDHDRTRADQADRLEVTPPRHTPPPRPTTR